MTKEDIKGLILRKYLDTIREQSERSIDIEEILDFADYIRDDSNKVIYYYEDVYDDTHEGKELDYDVIVKPIKEKLQKQPSLEKLEYMIDAIDFSLNFE